MLKELSIIEVVVGYIYIYVYMYIDGCERKESSQKK